MYLDIVTEESSGHCDKRLLKIKQVNNKTNNRRLS